MKKALSKISEGKTFDAICKEPGMRKSTFPAMVDSVVHAGYLEETQCETGCSLCLMKCNSPLLNSGIKMYTVTVKGMKFIKVAQMDG